VTTAWLDVQVAAAGDMLLAALIDAGASEDRVRDGLAGLGMAGWTLRTEDVMRGAFRAKRAIVLVDGEEEAGGPGHEHAHGHEHRHAHAHGHGSWRAIRGRIEGAPLVDRVKARALAVYGPLAAAEAHLHGVPVDDVVLHEVGSTDAVIDIVGVCLALEDLGVDVVIASPLPMGTGFVRAAHGRLALPAPATLQVLRGFPVVAARWPGEWVTPTGAALVAGLATAGPFPAMTPRAIGVGAGKKDPPEVANLVRVVIGDVDRAVADDVIELACNLDDATGALLAPVVAGLLDAGALDAWVAPVTMKKGRPGFVLHALARPADADRLGDYVLKHTTSLGVRRTPHSRQLLDRWWVEVATAWGAVRVKVGGRDGVAWHAEPELDDVVARAAEAGVPVAAVHRAAIAGWERRGG
jgi:uncharacterized protein (TIGR00299 family) protein